MKRNYKSVAVLLFICILTTGIQVFGVEKTKEYHESWPAQNVQTLEIRNKFGNVNVTSKGGSEVTIDVVVTVESPNEQSAEELLELINVSFEKTGNKVLAETHISNEFKSSQKFSIDYEVNIPTDKNLDITNKYGNTFVNELNASGTFDIQYGNFNANQLNAPSSGSMELNLAYGKGGVETASDMVVTIQYSSINIGQLDDLKLNSKYSVINLNQGNSVVTDSKYDTFNFGRINSVSANTKYTRIQIDEISEMLKIDAGYGGIRVGKVADNFESVSIDNSYGQINLGLGQNSYSLDATCNYCGISFPENDFEGDRMSEDNSRTVRGKVAGGKGGTVNIQSRYGQIKLD